jgi:N-acetylneuraminic acid mutarotase
MQKVTFALVALLVTASVLVNQPGLPVDAQPQAPKGVCKTATTTPTIAGGSWEARAPSPLHRSETAAATLNGKIYIAGGLAGQSSFFSGISTSFEVYDPSTDTWKELAPIPKALHHISLASAHGHLYMTGGYTALDFIANTKSTWVYDPQSDSWSAVADMPAPRAAATVSTINDIIYLVGGVTSASTQLWTYDPAADKWNTQHAPMPTAREHLTSAVVDGKLYVIGGEVPNPDGTGNETYQRLTTTEMYDPATDQWTALAPMPTPRSSITSAVINGQIHVVSGENVQDTCVFPQHEVYDPKTNTWSAMVDLATARHGAVSGVVDGKWYVIDGATVPGLLTITALSDTVEVFIPAQSS